MLFSSLAILGSIAFADTWQCPGHEPSVSMERVEKLDVLKMDRYRGYKPAWMALESEYRSAVFNWTESEVQNAYLENHNHYLDPYMYHERLRRMLVEHGDSMELWQIALHTLISRVCDFGWDSKDTNKPSITHTFAIHGNELIGVNYGLDAINYLLSHPEERSALNQDFNLWFVPMANPDGMVVDASSSRQYVRQKERTQYRWHL